MMSGSQDIRRGVRRGDGGMHASSRVQGIYEDFLSLLDEFQKQLVPPEIVGQIEMIFGKIVVYEDISPQTKKRNNVLCDKF